MQLSGNGGFEIRNRLIARLHARLNLGIAAHQIVITLDLLSDPVFGEPVAETSVWTKLLAKLEAVDHPYFETIRNLIGDPAGVMMSEVQRRRFGMTLDEARALFDIAVQPAEATEPDIVSVTTVRTEGPAS